MDLKAFRENAHTLVDWMADYLETLGKRPVVPDVRPGEIRAKLEADPPAKAEAFDAIFHDFREIVVPGVTNWQHPGWFAYFPANSSPPSVLAEMLMTTMGAQCMSWQTSPAATEMEQVMMDWVRKMLGLPAEFRGVIQDTASTATLVALLCARERATRHAFGKDGPTGEKLVVYASEEAHASVDKGAKLAGFGLSQLRRIPADGEFAMRPDALAAAIERDRADDLKPACVVATVGTTSSGAVDPVAKIAEICRAENVWSHVDAAWAGTAAICPELRHILDGCDLVDSFVFNPHKWMLTNFDCTAFFVRDVETLLHTFSTSPEYLRTAHDSEVVNFRDWQIQLGRRFRALKLWF
ncbi:MAG: pyridoxal phosphate-dependent decarboxylase family protein, partial [Planctomycetota bacterium]